MKTSMIDRLDQEANKYGFGYSKERLASMVYNAIRSEEADAAILNERYLMIADKSYQFIKSKKQSKWVVKEF